MIAEVLSVTDVRTLYTRFTQDPGLLELSQVSWMQRVCRNQFPQPCLSLYKRLSGTQLVITTALTSVGSVRLKIFTIQHEQVPGECQLPIHIIILTFHYESYFYSRQLSSLLRQSLLRPTPTSLATVPAMLAWVTLVMLAMVLAMLVLLPRMLPATPVSPLPPP